MQEGYIFPDTILGNIAPGEDNPDIDSVAEAVKVASLKQLLDELPSGLQTRVGQGGHGLSQGQWFTSSPPCCFSMKPPVPLMPQMKE
jgi:ATP-binding cassette subfamily B protein